MSGELGGAGKTAVLDSEERGLEIDDGRLEDEDDPRLEIDERGLGVRDELDDEAEALISDNNGRRVDMGSVLGTGKARISRSTSGSSLEAWSLCHSSTSLHQLMMTSCALACEQIDSGWNCMP